MNDPRIYIADPCHQDWDQMNPEAQGRFCGHCQQTVVNFTDWEAEDILAYLRTNSHTCARMRIDQLQQLPEDTHLEIVPAIAASSLPYWKKIAAVVALLFVFASAGYSQKPPVRQQDAPADTLKQPVRPMPEVMGKVMIPPQQPKDTVHVSPVKGIEHNVQTPSDQVRQQVAPARKK